MAKELTVGDSFITNLAPHTSYNRKRGVVLKAMCNLLGEVVGYEANLDGYNGLFFFNADEVLSEWANSDSPVIEWLGN